MRFAVTAAQRDFFAKHRYIEFEDLLSEEQIERLQSEIDRLLHKRPLDAEGHDLWRQSETVKKIAFKSTLAEIASSLFQTHLLRIAFDQSIKTNGTDAPFSEPCPLSQLSCVKPLMGAFLIRLSEEPLAEVPEQSLCPIPTKRTNLVFLSPELLIHWNLLFALKSAHLFLVAYAPKHALYQLEKKDPHTHALKKLGYVFGDRLNDAVHPIVYRD